MNHLSLALAVSILGICIAPVTAAAHQTIDPALVFNRVDIEEQPPFRSTGIGARVITIRFLVGAEPSCATERPQLTYSLLTDAFPWRRSPNVSTSARSPPRLSSTPARTCSPPASAGRTVTSKKLARWRAVQRVLAESELK